MTVPPEQAPLPEHLIPLLALAATADLPAARDISTTWPPDQRQAATNHVTDSIAANAAVIVSPTSRMSATERVEFTAAWCAVVRAIAFGSLLPEGISVFGRRWKAIDGGVQCLPATPNSGENEPLP